MVRARLRDHLQIPPVVSPAVPETNKSHPSSANNLIPDLQHEITSKQGLIFGRDTHLLSIGIALRLLEAP